MPTHILRPCRQGNLDSLCGLYAVLNATRRCFEKSDYKGKINGQSLFNIFVESLAKQRLFSSVALDGSSSKTMQRLFKLTRSLLEKRKLGLVVEQPFRSNKTTLKECLIKCNSHSLEKDQAVIILLEGQYCHWTVFDRITDTRLLLFDSNGLSYLPLKNVALLQSKVKSVHYLDATEIFFITIAKPKDMT